MKQCKYNENDIKTIKEYIENKQRMWHNIKHITIGFLMGLLICSVGIFMVYCGLNTDVNVTTEEYLIFKNTRYGSEHEYHYDLSDFFEYKIDPICEENKTCNLENVTLGDLMRYICFGECENEYLFEYHDYGNEVKLESDVTKENNWQMNFSEMATGMMGIIIFILGIIVGVIYSDNKYKR